jgi:hypothetical protein
LPNHHPAPIYHANHGKTHATPDARVTLAPVWFCLSVARTAKNNREKAMPRKPGLNSEFVMFDVVYEDGTQRSNRKVPRTLTGGIDGDKPAHGFLIEQDRDIAEKSGRPLAKIKSITRSGARKKERDYSEGRSHQ